MSTNDRATVAGTLMIASGATTFLASAGLFLGLIWICVGAFWLLPMAIGVMEIAVGAAIMGGRPQPSVRTMSVLGIIASLSCGNLIGTVLEVVALISLSQDRPQLTG